MSVREDMINCYLDLAQSHHGIAELAPSDVFDEWFQMGVTTDEIREAYEMLLMGDFDHSKAIPLDVLNERIKDNRALDDELADELVD